MDAVRPKTGKNRVLRTKSQLFTQDVSSLACFFISLAAYAGSQALQAVLFSSYLVHKKRRLWTQAFLAATVETGNKNRCVTKATHVCEESLGKINF